MWQVVYITNKIEAEELKDKLLAEGFLVKIEPMEDGSYQIKVPESEAEDVYDFLNDSY